MSVAVEEKQSAENAEVRAKDCVHQIEETIRIDQTIATYKTEKTGKILCALSNSNYDIVCVPTKCPHYMAWKLLATIAYGPVDTHIGIAGLGKGARFTWPGMT